MKEKILNMIELLKFGKHDPEIDHADYEELLQEFILNYDESLIDSMKELIAIEKDFWYA